VVASPTELNPGVASYLFTLTCEVIAAGGVDGCSIEKAQDLQQRAIKHLRHGQSESNQYRRPEYVRQCLYLGGKTGEVSPQGDPVFNCNHESHRQTTEEWCSTKCKDYDPLLATKPDAVKSWAVGITTAPRRQPTLSQSLRSLAVAGWDSPIIFAEPGSRIPNEFRSLTVVRRQTKFGAWPNFIVGLTELVMTQPDADAYFMVQDDTLFCRNTRHYLEHSLWPDRHTGAVSLHTPSHQVPEDNSGTGFFPKKVGWGAWGAMAFIFPNAAARALLRHPEVINHRSRGPGEGLCNVDSVVGHWCNIAGLQYVLHNPSLTQHIGLTTTLWSKDSLEGRRSASDFPGEDFDARRFTPL